MTRLKSVCKPVAMPAQFKEQLFDRLMREAKDKGAGDLNPRPL